MQSITVTALVLRHSDYKDYDRMLTLLSPEQGRIDVIARGCRRQGSRLLGATELFCCCQYVLRQKGERLSVVQATILESFYDLRLQMERYQMGCSVLESVLHVAQPGEEAEGLYQLTYYILSYLAYSQLHENDLMVCFLLKLLQNQGYTPSTTRCARCGASTFQGARFHPLLGTLCADCGKQKGGEAIAALSIEAMRRILALPLDELGNVSLPEEVREDLLDCVPRFFISHVGGCYQTPFFRRVQGG